MARSPGPPRTQAEIYAERIRRYRERHPEATVQQARGKSSREYTQRKERAAAKAAIRAAEERKRRAEKRLELARKRERSTKLKQRRAAHAERAKAAGTLSQAERDAVRRFAREQIRQRLGALTEDEAQEFIDNCVSWATRNGYAMFVKVRDRQRAYAAAVRRAKRAGESWVSTERLLEVWQEEDNFPDVRMYWYK